MVVVSLYIPSKKQAKQINELERRIIEDGYELLDEHKFIGSSDLESLRYKVAKGKIDRIYAHSLEHLSQKFAGQIDLLREFGESGAYVIFLNHKTGGNPMSKLLQQVEWAIEEYKRKRSVLS